jgi:hypothetical protein
VHVDLGEGVTVVVADGGSAAAVVVAAALSYCGAQVCEAVFAVTLALGGAVSDLRSFVLAFILLHSLEVVFPPHVPRLVLQNLQRHGWFLVGFWFHTTLFITSLLVACNALQLWPL